MKTRVSRVCRFPHETTTFKVRVNQVLLRVVVRDKEGNAVRNLPREAFEVLDNGKPQPVTSFSVKDAASKYLTASMTPADRAAIFTTSGKVMLNFTDDRKQLLETIASIQPDF